MNDTPRPRWYRPTPDRLVIGLLIVECLLWLSERFQWFGFNSYKGWTTLFGLAVLGIVILAMFLWFAGSLFFRWRFQFSILTMLLLGIAVAIPFGGLAGEMKRMSRESAAVMEIERLGGGVQFGYRQEVENGVYARRSEPPGLAWVRHWIGNGLFKSVTVVNFIGRPFTDSAMPSVVGLSQLQELYLAETQVTDVGLAQVDGLQELQSLTLGATRVTDAGLDYLGKMNRLELLSLYNTQVTDVGLDQLKGLTRLHLLFLSGTKVTDAGVKKLQQALPNCNIVK